MVRCFCGKRGGLQLMQRCNNFLNYARTGLQKSTDFDALFAVNLKKLQYF